MWCVLGWFAAAWAQEAEIAEATAEQPLDLETRIHGYGDVGLVGKSTTHPVGFVVGDVVLAFTASLDDKVEIDVDAVFGMDQHGDWLALVDRAAVDFRLSEPLTLTLGKFYAPLGWWNTNLPYGSWLYAPQSRPVMLQFERHGASLPIHQAGLDLHAVGLAGFWQLGAHAGVGNGRAAHLTETQDIGDGGLGKAVWLQLYVESPGGVQVGATGYFDDRVQVGHLAMDLSEDFGGGSSESMDTHVHVDQVILRHDTREAVAGGHLAYTGHPTEVLVEGMAVMHQRVKMKGKQPPVRLNEERRFDPYAPVWNLVGYAQVSQAIGEDVTPYARVDYVEFWHEDPLYRDMGRLKLQGVATLGTRVDIAVRAALKAEVTAQRDVVFPQVKKPSRLDEKLGGGLYLVAGF